MSSQPLHTRVHDRVETAFTISGIRTRYDVVPDWELSHLKVDYLNKTVADMPIVCSALLLESNRFEKAREGFLDVVQRFDVG